MELNDTNKETLAKSLNDSEIFKFLNLNCTFTHDQIHLRLDPIEDRHRGGTTGDSVNGAIVAAICDIAVGATVGLSPYRITLGSGVGRLDIKMQKPIQGDSCNVVARIERLAKNLIYSHVVFFDERDRRCVEARGTVYIRKV